MSEEGSYQHQIESCSEDLFLGLLRYIERKIRGLQDLLSDLDKKSIAVPEKIIPAEIVKTNYQSVRRLLQETAECVTKLHEMFSCEELFQRTDVIASVETEWGKIESLLSLVFPENIQNVNDIAADCSGNFFTESNDILHDLLCTIVKITILPRVNDHLEGYRLGVPLDFHSRFRDELPKEEDRNALLRWLKKYPLAIDGVIDVDKGLIYAAKPTRREKALTTALIVAPLFIGFLLAYFLLPNLGAWLNLSGWTWKASNATSLAAIYIFMLLGGLAHVVVDSLKKRRTTKGQTFVSVEDYLLWIHVKRVPMMGAIFTLVVGFVALEFLAPTAQWGVAFIVGYSIDSFVDVFLQRFADVMPSTESVVTQIGK